MVVALTALAGAVAAGVTVLAAPRLVAGFVSRVLKHLLADRSLHASLRRAAHDAGFPEWLGNVVAQGGKASLRDIIHDPTLRHEFLGVIVQAMQEDILRGELSQVVISLLKNGIRDASNDDELTDLVVTAIQQTLSDERLMSIVKGALKDALKDREIYESTVCGAIEALKEAVPFSVRLPHISSWREDEDAGVMSSPDSPTRAISEGAMRRSRAPAAAPVMHQLRNFVNSIPQRAQAFQPVDAVRSRTLDRCGIYQRMGSSDDDWQPSRRAAQQM